MSLMKRWFEHHIDELSDEDIFAFGCETQEEVDFLRECFTTKKKEERELT